MAKVEVTYIGRDPKREAEEFENCSCFKAFMRGMFWGRASNGTSMVPVGRAAIRVTAQEPVKRRAVKIPLVRAGQGEYAVDIHETDV